MWHLFSDSVGMFTSKKNKIWDVIVPFHLFGEFVLILMQIWINFVKSEKKQHNRPFLRELKPKADVVRDP